jgi:hypothetical protein
MKGKGRSAIPAINVLLAAYTLLCGMHVDQVRTVRDMLEINCLSEQSARVLKFGIRSL